MYVLVPTKVLAIELMSSPETPKSQILISPAVLTRMLEGLISAVVSPGRTRSDVLTYQDAAARRAGLTSMNDTVHVVQVHQAPQDRLGDLSDD